MSNEVLPYKAQFIIRAWDADKAGLRAKLAALRSAISKMNGAKYYDPALPTSARNYFYASVPGWCWDKYDDYAHYIEDANLANLLPISHAHGGPRPSRGALRRGERQPDRGENLRRDERIEQPATRRHVRDERGGEIGQHGRSAHPDRPLLRLHRARRGRAELRRLHADGRTRRATDHPPAQRHPNLQLPTGARR
ncbi:MAG: hypothetical protein R3F11_18820 [Verrucomicrobiales bacterium]